METRTSSFLPSVAVVRSALVHGARDKDHGTNHSHALWDGTRPACTLLKNNIMASTSFAVIQVLDKGAHESK